MSDRELRSETLRLRSAIIEADEALMACEGINLTTSMNAITPFSRDTGCRDTVNEVMGRKIFADCSDCGGVYPQPHTPACTSIGWERV